VEASNFDITTAKVDLTVDAWVLKKDVRDKNSSDNHEDQHTESIATSVDFPHEETALR
jgi:hypothetical protein